MCEEVIGGGEEKQQRIDHMCLRLCQALREKTKDLQWCEGGFVLSFGCGREKFSGEETCELRPEGSRREGCADTWRRVLQTEGNGKSKGPEAGKCLACLKCRRKPVQPSRVSK